MAWKILGRTLQYSLPVEGRPVSVDSTLWVSYTMQANADLFQNYRDIASDYVQCHSTGGASAPFGPGTRTATSDAGPLSVGAAIHPRPVTGLNWPLVEWRLLAST